MARFRGAWLFAVLLGSLAAAQGDLKSHLHPVTAPVRHAGVYHVATGTWTRGTSLNAAGLPVIYNNTCQSAYYAPMLSTEKYQHRSRIPSPNGPTTDSVFYGTIDQDHRWDERPGCSGRYTVRGFEIEYCSSHVGVIDWQHQFASSYTACGASDMVPQYTIALTGLPGGASNGDQRCWIVDVDLSGEPGGGIELSADGDGYYDGPSTVDQFGWSFQPTSPTTAADSTGPVLAGNYTYAGCGTGICVPCTGTDGTIWDFGGPLFAGPTPSGETQGTGMSSSDFFRVAGGPVSPPSGPGCYFFGSAVHPDFYLKLYVTNSYPCGKDPNPWPFCAPGVGGLITCPCGNPQVPTGSTRGCNNFVSGGTGGALLRGWGDSSISLDTLVMLVTAEAPSATISVLFQGTSNAVHLRYGAGVRCVGGTLKRLYKGDSSGGTIQFPNNGVSIHEQSAAVGFPISAPVTLFYYCAYRNSAANGQPGCPGLNFGFNSSNAAAISWTP